MPYDTYNTPLNPKEKISKPVPKIVESLLDDSG